MLPDESFLDQLKAGLPAAYVILVERFEGPLYRFFLCDHRDHFWAQEQTAETFAQLVRSLPGMHGGSEQLRALPRIIAEALPDNSIYGFLSFWRYFHTR